MILETQVSSQKVHKSNRQKCTEKNTLSSNAMNMHFQTCIIFNWNLKIIVKSTKVKIPVNVFAVRGHKGVSWKQKIIFKLWPALTLVCIYINNGKNVFSNFLRLIYLAGKGPRRGYPKKRKMAYKSHFPSFLLKISTHSFLKLVIYIQNPHFDFSFLPPQMIFLGFRIFQKKTNFWIKPKSWIQRTKKVVFEK